MGKCYSPGPVKMPDGSEVVWEDGGKMSCYLHSKRPGDYIDIMGPIGVHEYLGRGLFKTPGKTLFANSICMIAGGAGVTPMLQIIRAALRDNKDQCTFTLLYANK